LTASGEGGSARQKGRRLFERRPSDDFTNFAFA